MGKGLLLNLLGALLVFNSYGSSLTVTNTQNSGTGSLRNKIGGALNGDTIVFTPSLLTGGNSTILLLSEISFSKSITIIGLYNSSDSLFISGGNTNRIFNIVNTQNVVLDSLCFTNGYSSNNGGAVSASNVDNMFVKNCFFSNNSAVYPQRGGGLHFLGNSNSVSEINNILIDNCHFNQNSAQFGGGFASTSYSVYPNIVKIVNSAFSENTALHGGGVYYDNYTDSLTLPTPLVVENSLFSYNTTTSTGGGIYISMYGFANADVLIMDSKFIHNIASSGGGVNYGSYAETDFSLTIEDCELESNEGQNGGAIGLACYANTAILFEAKIIRSTLVGNQASSNGGGISLIASGSSPAMGSIEVSQSTFDGNKANGISSKGGAIFANASTSIFIKNSTLINQEAALNYGQLIDSNSDTSYIEITSSIIAFNGVKTINNANSDLFISGGFNIFSDTAFSGAIVTDQLGIDSSSLNLDVLNYNGGNTRTRLPLPGSLAIDNGNGNDIALAQNGLIIGIRDVGAAETCASTSVDIQNSCGSYDWLDGNTYTSNNNTAIYVLTNSIGCDSIIRLDLTLTSVNSTISVINPTTLTANQTGALYQWIDCDNSNQPIANETNQTFTTSNEGNYAVIMTIGNCTDTSNCFKLPTLGINELISNDFYVYPNPGNGSYTFKSTSNAAVSSFYIQNVDGKMVKQASYDTGLNEFSFLIKEFENGIYYLTVIQNDDVPRKTIKIVKK